MGHSWYLSSTGDGSVGSYYAAGFPLNKKDLKIELDDWPIIFGGYTYADSDFWEG